MIRFIWVRIGLISLVIASCNNIFNQSIPMLNKMNNEHSAYLIPYANCLLISNSNRNRNRNLKTSKALLKSQAHQGTSLFTSAATNQRGFPKGGQEKLRSEFQ